MEMQKVIGPGLTRNCTRKRLWQSEFSVYLCGFLGRCGYLDQYSRTKKHHVLILLLTATLYSFCPTGVWESLGHGRVAIVSLRHRSIGIIVDLTHLVLDSGIQSNIFVMSPCFPLGGCQPVTKYARIPGLL